MSFKDAYEKYTSLSFKDAYEKIWLFLLSIKNSRKRQIVCWGILISIISIYIPTLILETSLVAKEEITQVFYNPFYVIYIWIIYLKETILLSVICFGSFSYLIFYLYRLFKKEYVYDKERRVKVAKEGGYGNAHFMTEEEKAVCMEKSKNPEEMRRDIIGMDHDGYLYARLSIRFSNDNVIVNGPPGCGKSTCILNNDILQYIKRGESFIIIDTKGAIYRDTSYAAKKAGYNVKIFNIKPDETEYSDGVDFFKIIQDVNKAKGIANSLANTIMMNINDENVKKDIWFNGAFNLLKAAILITKFDEMIPEEKRTLGTMYMTLVENSNFLDLQEKWRYVLDNRRHPAYEAWKTFYGQRDVIKESVLGGLLTNLNILSDDITRELVSNDEIDFTSPGFEKCAYYIVIDDQDKSNNVLACLFLECCSMQLKNAADHQKGSFEAKLPVPVNFEIDEMYSVGKLPNMSQKLSTYRSRGMLFKLFIQDLSQLKDMYPREQWKIIVTDCTTMIILKVGEQETAEYIEKEMGTQTIIVDNVRDARTAGEPFHLKFKYQSTEGKGTRPLMFASEIRGEGKTGLKDTELLLLIKGQAPLKLKKWMWTEHPLCKALHLDNEKRKMYCTDHIPEWRKAYEKREEEEQNRAIYIDRQVLEIPSGHMIAVDLNKNREKKVNYEKSKRL